MKAENAVAQQQYQRRVARMEEQLSQLRSAPSTAAGSAATATGCQEPQQQLNEAVQGLQEERSSLQEQLTQMQGILNALGTTDAAAAAAAAAALQARMFDSTAQQEQLQREVQQLRADCAEQRKMFEQQQGGDEPMAGQPARRGRPRKNHQGGNAGATQLQDARKLLRAEDSLTWGGSDSAAGARQALEKFAACLRGVAHPERVEALVRVIGTLLAEADGDVAMA
ncbi:hypothetical protein OEZ85_000165 [Tetradesmus obliquus]|uniref:GRIP domain-containing protein n=1 Tax=Tetradesmus obliquus TaxID=3088 RepID=A0ABY8UPB5_TETOB|nr:hypothetical protein OEZ85_000165 [Tetradesmus obliquus]